MVQLLKHPEVVPHGKCSMSWGMGFTLNAFRWEESGSLQRGNQCKRFAMRSLKGSFAHDEIAFGPRRPL